MLNRLSEEISDLLEGGLISRSSGKGSRALKPAEQRKAQTAGWNAAAGFESRRDKGVREDFAGLFIDAMERGKLPSKTEDDPDFWEWHEWFNRGVKAYFAKKGGFPAKFVLYGADKKLYAKGTLTQKQVDDAWNVGYEMGSAYTVDRKKIKSVKAMFELAQKRNAIPDVDDDHPQYAELYNEFQDGMVSFFEGSKHDPPPVIARLLHFRKVKRHTNRPPPRRIHTGIREDKMLRGLAEEIRGLTEAKRLINQNDYKFWVLVGSKIASGWEYREDAKDALDDLPSGKKGKVLTRAGLRNKGIDPDNNEHWHTGRGFSESAPSYEFTVQEYDALKSGQKVRITFSGSWSSGTADFKVGRTSYSKKYDVYSKTLIPLSETGDPLKSRAKWTLFKRPGGFISLGHAGMAVVVRDFQRI